MCCFAYQDTQCAIHLGAKIPAAMLIVVKTGAGKKIALNVEGSDEIARVKAKLRNVIKVCVKEQCLTFNSTP